MSDDKTILVIDDSATIRKLVDTHLSPVGYRVVLAPNAEDGLQLAAEVEPDLILLDWMLPGQSGIEFVRLLRSDPATRAIPVVLNSKTNVPRAILPSCSLRLTWLVFMVSVLLSLSHGVFRVFQSHL